MNKLYFLWLAVFPFITLAQKADVNWVPIESSASFRALSVVDDSIVWLGGTNGTVCLSADGGINFSCRQVPGYDSADFRSLFAFDEKTALICNIGSPAAILRTVDGGLTWTEVYSNNNTEAFIDGIEFWNEMEGICYGDPIDGKLMLLRTVDGGKSWNRLPVDSRPLLVEGEASFAASGTAIRCYENERIIIATGGELSRLLVSNDKGITWKTILVPIIQGREGTGIFSFDFIDHNHGVVVGGDYKSDTLMQDHVFFTSDGCDHWQQPSSPTRGYRECVAYITSGKLLAVGPGGIDISIDGGVNWKPFSELKKNHVVRKARKGKLVVIAGGGGVVGLYREKD